MNCDQVPYNEWVNTSDARQEHSRRSSQSYTPASTWVSRLVSMPDLSRRIHERVHYIRSIRHLLQYDLSSGGAPIDAPGGTSRGRALRPAKAMLDQPAREDAFSMLLEGIKRAVDMRDRGRLSDTQ